MNKQKEKETSDFNIVLRNDIKYKSIPESINFSTKVMISKDVRLQKVIEKIDEYNEDHQFGQNIKNVNGIRKEIRKHFHKKIKHLKKPIIIFKFL